VTKKNLENQICNIKAVGKVEGPLHVQTERKLQMLKRDTLSSELQNIVLRINRVNLQLGWREPL
jgi:hypothetical protein